MIHLIYGEDSLAVEETLQSLRVDDSAGDLYDVNTTTLNGASVSLPELEAAWSTIPFMADKRTVIVRDLLARMQPRSGGGARSRGGSKSAMGEWADIGDRLAHVPQSTDLIFIDGDVKGNNPLLRAIRPLAQVHECKLPSVRDMPAWVRQRADKLGTAIEPSSIAALVDSIGNDTRLIDMEMQKLALYRSGGAIRRQDVEALVSYAREANIFAAVDAALEGRVGIALRMAHQLLDAGQHPVYVITMLARQVRYLILAKDLKARGMSQVEIGSRINLRGYPLTKTMQQEPRFSAERLVEIHRRLLEADLSIKTGAADEEMALDTLIIALAERA
ncbi:MAG: DNA polymerase III subunit delta [Chloroflexi bacterium]|nr:DNA polymerase III subunit delta [Chloroflexota bacterium]